MITKQWRPQNDSAAYSQGVATDAFAGCRLQAAELVEQTRRKTRLPAALQDDLQWPTYYKKTQLSLTNPRDAV